MRRPIQRSSPRHRHTPARQDHPWVQVVSSSHSHTVSAARDARDTAVEAALAAMELEVRLLKVVPEVREEEVTSTSVIREILPTTVVSLGLRTYSAVSRLTVLATLWVRTAAIRRAEHTDASRGRACEYNQRIPFGRQAVTDMITVSALAPTFARSSLQGSSSSRPRKPNRLEQALVA